MKAIYPRLVCEPAGQPLDWKVILPFGKGVQPFLRCQFVRIDKSWAPHHPEWWQIVVARIDRRWSPEDPDWWEADFSRPIYLPYPQ